MLASRTRFALGFALVALLVVPTTVLRGDELESAAPADEVEGVVYELDGVDEVEAETLLASAEAALWLPELRRVRWLDTRPAVAAFRVDGRSPRTNVSEFTAALDADYPALRTNRFGPYLLKLPDRRRKLATTTAVPPLASDATALSDSFESGMDNWHLADNTGGRYAFTRMGCTARTGSWSADAVRGGTAGQHMFCSDSYPANIVTQITHNTCDAIRGAGEAWLDFYVSADMDASEAVGVYYEASDGFIYGYAFSGSWSGWNRIVLNLKQWNHVGDLTALPCAQLIFQFRSDTSAASGAGAFIDDITIRTDPPAALRCAITASPTSGAPPLTVNFAPSVYGSSGTETYQWQFGDAGANTSTSRNASFTYTTTGEYWARLRVIDAANVRAYAHTLIQVSAGPSCSVSCSATVPTAGTTASAPNFQATASASGCSGSPAYRWTFGDGQSSTQQNVSHAYASPGSYNWTLTVTAGTGTCTRSGTITITAPNTSTTRRRSVSRPGSGGGGSGSVSVSVSGTTATVTQTGNLSGLAWTFPQSVPSGFAVSTMPVAQAPAIPSGVTRLSEFFTVSPRTSGSDLITVTLPVAALPGGRSAKDLRLYVYTDAAVDEEKGGNSFKGTFWIRSWYDLNVLSSGKPQIKLTGLGDLSFVGIEAPVSPPPTASSMRMTIGPAAVTSSCAPKALANGTTDANQQVCTISYEAGKSFVATVKNLGDLHLTPAATLNDLTGWLGAARAAFDGYGMSSDATFEVDIGPMPAEAPTALGFVTTRNHEDYRVLHITSAPKAKNSIQGTTVHEYFHHAQARTTEAGKTNLLGGGAETLWLTEGLARWVEDDIFDSLNTYTLKEQNPLLRIMAVGLAASDDSANDDRTRGYARFAFWKMVQMSCSGFQIPQILNVAPGQDPSGVKNFKTRLESASWQCDFGAGLGDDNRRTLAGALAKYLFATVKNDDLSLLDTNEPGGFHFTTTAGLPTITPSADCTGDSPCTSSRLVAALPPGGAAAVILNAVNSPPEGMIASAWLDVDTPEANAFVWVGNAETLLTSTSQGGSTEGGGAVAYGEAGRAPQALAFLVNPSETSFVNVKLRAGFATGLTFLSDGFTEPLLDWGRPQRAYDISVYLTGLDETKTRYVWSFGDGTAKTTVTGSNTVKHTYASEGQFTLGVELYDNGSGTKLATGSTVAKIGWFRGTFAINTLNGQSAGSITWPSVLADEKTLIDGITANPASGRIEFVELGGVRSIWLSTAMNHMAIGAQSSDPTWDMQSFMSFSGNSLTARGVRYGYTPVSGGTYSVLWIDDSFTQTGASLSGTFTVVGRSLTIPPVETGRTIYTFTATRKE